MPYVKWFYTHLLRLKDAQLLVINENSFKIFMKVFAKVSTAYTKFREKSLFTIWSISSLIPGLETCLESRYILLDAEKSSCIACEVFIKLQQIYFREFALSFLNEKWGWIHSVFVQYFHNTSYCFTLAVVSSQERIQTSVTYLRWIITQMEWTASNSYLLLKRTLP